MAVVRASAKELFGRGLSVLVLAAGGVGPARADTVDPSLPRVVVVGAPRGMAPSERLDPRRTGRARTLLPASPQELWRRHVAGNIDVPPLVDDAGNVIVVLTIPEILKLGPDAREVWRARFGGGSALVAPVLLSDGTIVVVTTSGTAMGFTSSGALRFSTPLGVARRDADTAPLALSDGGLLIAAGNTLVELDADGVIRARGTLEDRGPSQAVERALGAVVEGPSGALVTTATGSVYRFRPPAAPRKIGSFGGVPSRGAMLADDRTLVAVVDGRRLVALDLPSGTLHVRASGLFFDGPPALGQGGVLFVATPAGTLLGVDAAGNEKTLVPLDKPLAPAAGAAPGVSLIGALELKPSPPVIVDSSGRVAFTRANGRTGLVTFSDDAKSGLIAGHVTLVNERICAAPVGVLPAGDKRILVACRDGGLWMYGE